MLWLLSLTRRTLNRHILDGGYLSWAPTTRCFIRARQLTHFLLRSSSDFLLQQFLFFKLFKINSDVYGFLNWFRLFRRRDELRSGTANRSVLSLCWPVIDQSLPTQCLSCLASLYRATALEQSVWAHLLAAAVEEEEAPCWTSSDWIICVLSNSFKLVFCENWQALLPLVTIILLFNVINSNVISFPLRGIQH